MFNYGVFRNRKDYYYVLNDYIQCFGKKFNQKIIECIDDIVVNVVWSRYLLILYGIVVLKSLGMRLWKELILFLVLIYIKQEILYIFRCIGIIKNRSKFV